MLRLLRGGGYLLLLLLLAELVTRGFFAIRGLDVREYRHFELAYGAGRLRQPDPLLGWKLRPDASRRAVRSGYEVSYRTNAQGHRDAPLLPGRFRILLLGDSQTFGIGVPSGQRFSELLEAELPGVEVVNAAVPGYGVHQMARALERDGMSLQPDLVICALIRQDVGRAFLDQSGAAPHVVEAAHSELEAERAASSYEWWETSYLLAFASVRARIFATRRRLAREDRARYPPRERSDPRPATEEELRNVAVRFLDEMNQIAGRASVPLVVVDISSSDPTSTRWPIPWLADLLAERRIPFLDLTAPLTGRGDLAHHLDPHFNARGHRLIATRLREFLLAEGLVPVPGARRE